MGWEQICKRDQAWNAASEALLDGTCTVVDERLMAALEEKELIDLQKTWEGMLVVLPAPKPRITEEEDYAAALIRRTIGYHLKL